VCVHRKLLREEKRKEQRIDLGTHLLLRSRCGVEAEVEAEAVAVAVAADKRRADAWFSEAKADAVVVTDVMASASVGG
jgi:hypothetical protein